MNTVHKICKQVVALTDEELDAAEIEANEQVNHLHPLKVAKQFRINKAGKHNLRVIAAVRNLRNTITAGKPT